MLWGLLDHPNRSVEESNAESNVDCGGPAQGFQRWKTLATDLERNLVIVWQKKNNCFLLLSKISWRLNWRVWPTTSSRDFKQPSIYCVMWFLVITGIPIYHEKQQGAKKKCKISSLRRNRVCSIKAKSCAQRDEKFKERSWENKVNSVPQGQTPLS